MRTRRRSGLRLGILLALAARPAAADWVTSTSPIYQDQWLVLDPVTETLFAVGGSYVNGQGVVGQEIVALDAATGVQIASAPLDFIYSDSDTEHYYGPPRALDPFRNRVYLLRPDRHDLVVIDGRDLSMVTVPVPEDAKSLLLDAAANRIWLRGAVIDGDTLETTLLPGVAGEPSQIDPLAHRIYFGGQWEVDEQTLAVRTLAVPDLGPNALNPSPPAELRADPYAQRVYTTIDSFSLISGPFAWTMLTYDANTLDVLSSVTGSQYVQTPDSVAYFDPYHDVWGIREPADLFPCTWNFGLLSPSGWGGGIGCTTNFAYDPVAHRAYGFSDDFNRFGFETDDFDSSAQPVAVLLPGESATSRYYGGDVLTDPASGRLYATSGPKLIGAEAVERRPTPITADDWNERPTAGGDVTVHFTAASGFAPHALPVEAIWYQPDALDGAWQPATPLGATGTATIHLAPGAHVLHAFATDGYSSLSPRHALTPIVGQRTSLPIFVNAPQPTVDIGLASDWDGQTLSHDAAFPFQLSLVNGTASAQTFAFQLTITAPGLGTFSIIPATGFQLPPGVGFAKAIQIPLSAAMPAGTYQLGAVLFQSGVGVVDRSSLTFTIQ